MVSVTTKKIDTSINAVSSFRKNSKVITGWYQGMAKVRDRTEDFKDAVNRGALSLGFNEVGFHFLYRVLLPVSLVLMCDYCQQSKGYICNFVCIW